MGDVKTLGRWYGWCRAVCGWVGVRSWAQAGKLVILGHAALVACWLLSGCHAEDPASVEAVQQKRSHSTVETPLVSLSLPAGGDVRKFGLVAQGSLDLRDRARVRDQQGAPLDVYNVGSLPGAGPSTSLGSWDTTPGYATGDIISHGRVLLRDRAKVGGDVITAGTIQKQN